MQSWEQQPNEKPKPYQAFSAYRDAGAQRSSRKAWEDTGGLGVTLDSFERWSSQYEWVERVQAYDQHVSHLDAERQVEAELQQRTELRAKRIAINSRILELAENALKAENCDKASKSDFAQLAQAAARASAQLREDLEERPAVALQINLKADVREAYEDREDLRLARLREIDAFRLERREDLEHTGGNGDH